jgi:hypothetical protein
VGYNAQTLQAVLFRPRCKLWSCPYCAQVNTNLWAVRAYFGAQAYAEGGITISFLTLTSHEKLTPQQAMWVFPRAWKKLSQRARRAADQFSYLMVPEKTKKGVIHVHAIETSCLGTEWWSDNARASGMGYKSDESEVRTSQGSAAYVVKYLSKSLVVEDWPARFRRIRTSRDWPPLPELVSPVGWEFASIPLSEPLDQVYKRYEARGYDIRILSSALAWALIDPQQQES